MAEFGAPLLNVDEEEADVTVIFRGRTFAVHGVLLRGRSQVFARMLSGECRVLVV
jgi:hypothetical protein